MAKKKKFYVVWQGNEPGIYDSWAACLQQVKGYPAAKYKSFPTRAQAEGAFANSYDDYISTGTYSKKSIITEEARAEIDFDTICVDAACSGNPGPMEYRGVETESQLQLFIQKFPIGTNNIGEFLAIVHGLAHLQKENNLKMPIYSDSKHAIKWVHMKLFVKTFQEKYPSIKVTLQDERYTSREAKRTIIGSGINKKKRKDKSLVDKIAAVIILQQYIEKKHYSA